MKNHFIIIFISFYISNVYAINGISIGYGNGVEGLKPLRIGIQKNWERQWLKDYPWNCKGYWELSFYNMESKNGNDFNNNNYNRKIKAISITPVFRFYKVSPILQNKKFYAEIAVGIAQLNKRNIGKRELGTNFQFEDRLGLGVRFGNNEQYDLGYRVIHFSNAYIGKKNHGINLHMLYINYWF